MADKTQEECGQASVEDIQRLRCKRISGIIVGEPQSCPPTKSFIIAHSSCNDPFFVAGAFFHLDKVKTTLYISKNQAFYTRQNIVPKAPPPAPSPFYSKNRQNVPPAIAFIRQTVRPSCVWLHGCRVNQQAYTLR